MLAASAASTLLFPMSEVRCVTDCQLLALILELQALLTCHRLSRADSYRNSLKNDTACV